MKTDYYTRGCFCTTVTIKQYKNLLAPFYPDFDEDSFYKYLDMLELSVNGKLSKLSFGQQKFVIAFTLACNTKLLLMDEPTNGLDIPSKIVKLRFSDD